LVDSGASPVVRRRRLASELRRLRTAAGRTLEEVAEYLECSPAKISRIETGQVSVRVQDVRDLLECYGVAGADRDPLLALVREARKKGWWRAYADLLSDDFQTYIGLEDEARTIWTYESHLIPGLLQTERFGRALMTTQRETPLEDVDRGWDVRRTRQAILARADPPRLHVILDEAVLRRAAGGAEVMVAQYGHLVTVASRPTVTLQVVPFSAGAHPAGGFPFTVLGFTDPSDPKIAYTELLTAAYCLDRAEDVGRYLATFDDLRGRALDPAQSLALVRELARRSAGEHRVHPS
jgi:transcriptional regulator with XRE-family HTH domain